ncbi:hypothetical protein [Marilutibacter alkalisoli]|uniref:Uncharacterized protein n=1 Tax=Marilutibacter alkalisoli TaxID=2591633 RepID=A0A514BU05_9GAMM|nr:hypothetical protein [Lysobacter alkalisoli]QDH70883.1 hypothetical protein FKV23_12900 [Lysobacter alkalisoli]
MNTHDEHAHLRAAAKRGCRIQIWRLLPGATSSADGQWDNADSVPQFTCPAHLYRVHPQDRASPIPSGYAYRYPDGSIRHTNAREINGMRPVSAIPYFYGDEVPS